MEPSSGALWCCRLRTCRMCYVFCGHKQQSAGALNKNLPGGSRVCRSPKRKRGERRTDPEPFGLRFRGVRASAQSAKRVSASGRSRHVWSAFWLLGFSPCIAWGASCWDWAWRCLRSVDTRNRPPRKSKTPSVFGWRREHAGNRVGFSARLSASRFVLEASQNAIREGRRIRPALNAAHSGGFRFRENVRMSLIQNGRGERI
jgi:hypothetical protein